MLLFLSYYLPCHSSESLVSAPALQHARVQQSHCRTHRLESIAVSVVANILQLQPECSTCSVRSLTFPSVTTEWHLADLKCLIDHLNDELIESFLAFWWIDCFLLRPTLLMTTPALWFPWCWIFQQICFHWAGVLLHSALRYTVYCRRDGLVAGLSHLHFHLQKWSKLSSNWDNKSHPQREAVTEKMK